MADAILIQYMNDITGSAVEAVPYNTGKGIIYTSLKQCSAATGVSMGLLRAAKSHKDAYKNGFNASNRVHWKLAESFIKSHLNELESATDDSLIKWKTKKTKAEAYMAEIELDEAKKLFVKRNEVEIQIKAIALAMKVVLKNKLTQELPSRLLGLDAVAMSVVLDTVLNEVCDLMSNLKL